jgi:2'-5' RNA ligase
MKLKDLLEFKNDTPEGGSYVAEEFDAESADKLYEFAKSLDVENLVPKEKYHITLIYSKKSLPTSFKVKPLSERNPVIVEPKGLNIFQTQEGNNCLVVEFFTPDLVKRHESLMSKYNLTYDFDSYIPHVSISYNCGDYEIPDDVNFKSIKELKVVNEYHEPLNLDWTKENI